MSNTLNDKESYAYARQQAERNAIDTLANDLTLSFDGVKIRRSGQVTFIMQTPNDYDPKFHCDLFTQLLDARCLNIDVKSATLKNRKGEQTNYTIDQSSVDYVRDLPDANLKKSYWYMLEMYDSSKQPTGVFKLVQAEKLVSYIDQNSMQPKQGNKPWYLVTPEIVEAVGCIITAPDIPA